MKFLVVSAMLLAVVVAAPDYIQTLNDNFDFNQLSVEQLKGVAMCLLDQGPCDDLLNSYKQHYPGVVINACKNCNKSQKAISSVFFNRLQEELPEVYSTVRKHADPEGKYFDNFLSAIKN